MGSSGVSIMLTEYLSAESSYVEWVSGFSEILFMPCVCLSSPWLSISFTDLPGSGLFKLDLQTFAWWFCLFHRRHVRPIAWHLARCLLSQSCPQFLQLWVGALLLLFMPLPFLLPIPRGVDGGLLDPRKRELEISMTGFSRPISGVAEASNDCLACMANWLLMSSSMLTASSRAFSGVRVVFSSSFCIS